MDEIKTFEVSRIEYCRLKHMHYFCVKPTGIHKGKKSGYVKISSESWNYEEWPIQWNKFKDAVNKANGINNATPI